MTPSTASRSPEAACAEASALKVTSDGHTRAWVIDWYVDSAASTRPALPCAVMSELNEAAESCSPAATSALSDLRARGNMGGRGV